MAFYRKTTPSSYPNTSVSNFTDSTKNWRGHSNLYRKTSGNETSSLTAVPGRYTDSTRAWRRIKAMYRVKFAYYPPYYSPSAIWEQVFYKNRNQPYAVVNPAMRYESYSGPEITNYYNGTYYLTMGPGSEWGTDTVKYIWGSDGSWEPTGVTLITTRTFYYNTTIINNPGNESFDDEGNTGGDKLRNSEAVLGTYDNLYLWYRVRKSYGTSLGTEFSKTTKVIKQSPVINSLNWLSSNSTVSAGSSKTVEFSFKNEWWRSVNRTNSTIEYHILDTQFSTPSSLSRVAVSSVSGTTSVVDNSTTYSGSYVLNVPLTFNGASTSGKWLYVQLVASNSYTEFGLTGPSPYSIVSQISAGLNPPTSVSVASVSRYSDTETLVTLSHSGGSGPYYQLFWTTASTLGTENRYDAASNSSSSSISEVNPFSAYTYYFYVRSSSENISTTYTQGTGTNGTYSAYSNLSTNPSYTFASPTGGSASISGSTTVGSTLTLSSVTPSASPDATSSTIKWRKNDGGTGGNTFTLGTVLQTGGTTYVINTSAGYSVRAEVTYNNGVGSLTVNSNAITVTSATLPVPTLGTYVAAPGGFSIPITNYSSSNSYNATAGQNNSTTTPSATVSGSNVVFTNMSNNSYSYVNIYVSRSGYTSNSDVGNINYYGYSENATYTVSYNANGGTGAPSSQTKTHDVTLTLSSTLPTRTGYTFNRWNTSSTGVGTDYSSGGSYTNNVTVTLYAIWIQNASVTTPTSLNAYVQSSSIYVSFDGGTGDYYDVYYANSNSRPTDGQASSDFPNVTSPYNTGLTQTGIQRWFWVRKRSVGTGTAYSNWYPAGTGATTIIPAPSGTAPSTPTGLSNSYASGPSWTGSWSASTGTSPITYYWTLYQSQSNGGAITSTASGSTTGTSFTKSMSSAYGLWAYFTVYAYNSTYGSSGTATSGWA